MKPAVLLLLTIAAPLHAQEGMPLSAAKAQAAIAGCTAHALAKKQSFGIAVVDSGGHVVAALRMDGNGSGVMAFAEQKARAAASWGFATSGMEESVKTLPGFASAPFIVTVAGGVPIWSADGRTQVGAIGVSGEAPADDVACAEAGIAAAGLAKARRRD